MSKIAMVSAIAIFVAGCAQQPVKLIAPEYRIVKPPADFYNCPVNKKFPDPKNLTNQQVGSLLLTAQKNNMICKNSLDQIQKYMDDAEKVTGRK